jgi:hypothetical protein
MAFREEATYGVYDVAGTDVLARIDDPAFALDPVPAYYVIRTADSGNEPVLELSGRKVIAGDFNTFLFADGSAPDDWAGSILKWATDISSGDLPSFSVTEWDGVRFRRSLGCKIGSLNLSCAAETQEGGLRCRMQILGMKPDTDPVGLTAPAASAYPKLIYRHVESKGGLIFRATGSSVRAKYRSFSLDIKNMVSANFDEDSYATDITYEGRDISGSFSVRFESKTDRDSFEGRSTHTASILFSKLTTTPKHTLSLDLQTQCRITGLDRERPLDKRQYEMVKFMAYLDPTSGKTIGFTTANPA